MAGLVEPSREAAVAYATAAPAGAAVIELAGIVKSFGRQRALDNVSLAVQAGSVHGLVGENGAGKSTLGKVLSGVVRPDTGTISIDGAPVAFSSPSDALRLGVTIMEQELSLATDLSVRENVLLGRTPARLGFVSRRGQRREYDALLERTGFELDGDAEVRGLPLAQQQEVEILRALVRGARVIVMDEPTSALSAQDAQRLHTVVRTLRGDGIAVIYVSHFLEEVLALCDTVTIMRNGRRVRTGPSAAETVQSLVTGMLGRSHEANYPIRGPVASNAQPVLEVRNLRRRQHAEGVSLAVSGGEVLGLFGLVGAGRSELAHALFGAEPGVSGEVLVDGRVASVSTPRSALTAGIALLPENRKGQGLFFGMSQRANTTMTYLSDVAAAGILRSSHERRIASGELESMGVSPIALNGDVGVLSGGNQQKVLFAKTLLRRPRVLILDEPTRGVDVGARRAIYDIVAELAADGMAVILISSDFDEVSNMSHRLLVMREGHFVAELDAATASHEVALAAAFGVAISSPFIKDVT